MTGFFLEAVLVTCLRSCIDIAMELALRALVWRVVLYVLLLAGHRPAPASGCCSHYSRVRKK
jgi:hypothetical protein